MALIILKRRETEDHTADIFQVEYADDFGNMQKCISDFCVRYGVLWEDDDTTFAKWPEHFQFVYFLSSSEEYFGNFDSDTDWRPVVDRELKR